MGNRQNCAKFQEKLFRSIEIISIFCPPLFRKRPIVHNTLDYQSSDRKIDLRFSGLSDDTLNRDPVSV